MKVCLEEDEKYPFYALNEKDEECWGDVQVDIPEEKMKWIQQVMKEFKKVQGYLANLYEAGRK